MENRITSLFGIRYPIVAGGMIWCSGWRLAAAVSEAGGLGLIGSGSMTPDLLREHIRKCRAATSRPFGVNVPLAYRYAPQLMDVITEERVPAVFTSAGNPATWTARLHDAGCRVAHVVSSSKFALKSREAGVDAVVAEGFEAGGHNGREETTTMALVPQVVDAVDVPVIAAGGIANGRQLAAAFALGACGVQVGTCLLVSEECPVHENYKAALLRAKDSDTIVTGRIGGTPVRVLKNRMSREYVRQEKAGADKMELEKYTLGSLRRAVFEGDTVSGSLMAGQVAGMLHEVRPVADILADLWQGGRQRIAALNTEC